MNVFVIILREILRLYFIGLLLMALVTVGSTIAFGASVSWATIASATSWASVVGLPLMVGAYASAGYEAGRLLSRGTRAGIGWVRSAVSRRASSF